MNQATLARGIGLGLIGGLAGTLVMDLVLVALFTATGMPPDLTFSFIRDTTARFLALLGMPVAGGAALGVLVHYTIGLALGGIFGGAVSQVRAMRMDSRAKGTLLGFFYIEVVSQPILATAPLIRQMTMSDTLQWYGLSFFMHLICGAVLGLVVNQMTFRPSEG